jgi:hypothetical protein
MAASGYVWNNTFMTWALPNPNGVEAFVAMYRDTWFDAILIPRRNDLSHSVVMHQTALATTPLGLRHSFAGTHLG